MLSSIKRSGWVWLWIAALVIALDRLSKMWVLDHIVPYESLPLLPVFNFTLAFNTGAAFSFLHSQAGWQLFIFSGLALVVSAFLLVWLFKLSARDRWVSVALTLIIGGALGNAWDRWLYGHVVDFLDFHLGSWHFAVFNIADSAISVGAVMLLIHWLWLAKE